MCFGKISDVAWEKMHFTWFSRRDGFSPTRHQILPSPLRGSGQDTVSSWEKTPSPGKSCEMHIFPLLQSLKVIIVVKTGVAARKAIIDVITARKKIQNPIPNNVLHASRKPKPKVSDKSTTV